MQAAVDTTAAISAQAPLLWGGGVALGGIVPLIAAGLAFKKVDVKTWKMTSALALIAGIIGAICIRVAFFELGFSVYMFF